MSPLGQILFMVIALMGMFLHTTLAAATVSAVSSIATATSSVLDTAATSVSVASGLAGSSSNFPNDLVKSWAQFCNDLTCDDCGSWVDMSNDACLVENYRKAVNVKRNGPGDSAAALIVSQPLSLQALPSPLPLNGPKHFVLSEIMLTISSQFTPNDQCSCQSDCLHISGNGCWQFFNTTNAYDTHSYRFVNFGDINKPCDGTVDNCWPHKA